MQDTLQDLWPRSSRRTQTNKQGNGGEGPRVLKSPSGDGGTQALGQNCWEIIDNICMYMYVRRCRRILSLFWPDSLVRQAKQSERRMK